MTREALKEILAKHKLWLEEKDGGERADMWRADMWRVDMRGANMRRANLQYADMQDVDMRGADMRRADMQDADMQEADMRGANMQRANLQYADMRHADMHGANLEGADMHGANLEGANMRGTDIDYSAWPLWCGSLKAHVDNRIAIQLLYHALSVVQHSPYVSEDIKRTLLTPDVVKVANRFHRVGECEKLETFNGGTNE